METCVIFEEKNLYIRIGLSWADDAQGWLPQPSPHPGFSTAHLLLSTSTWGQPNGPEALARVAKPSQPGSPFLRLPRRNVRIGTSPLRRF